MRVLTSGFPAEYGRKLGGVVEVTSEKNPADGFHGEAEIAAGSFMTGEASGALSYAAGKHRFSITGDGFHTDRYLDPPVLQNYTNRANTGGFSAGYDYEPSDRDDLSVFVSRGGSPAIMVPNELVQQQAGQRQSVGTEALAVSFAWQHIFSPDLLLASAGDFRDSGFDLSSNSLSTPVIAFQDRGFRNGYWREDVSWHHGRHDWKAGADFLLNRVHENLSYDITDPSQFEPGTTPSAHFSDRGWDRESAAYIQDQIRLGRWNIAAGLRFDAYSFLVHETAWSPRLSISRLLPAGFLVHASYDRVFQTPATENLLLASSPQIVRSIRWWFACRFDRHAPTTSKLG